MSKSSTKPQSNPMSSAVTKALSSHVRPVTVSPVANAPTYRGPGRPVGSNTGRQQLVNVILRAFAIELQVPLSAIVKYDPAKWALCLSRLSTPVIDKVMARLHHSLPHPTAGVAATLHPTQIGYAAGFFDGEGCLSIVKTKPRMNRKRGDYRATFQVAQSNQQVLLKIQGILGAHSYVRAGKKTIKLNRQPFSYIVATPVHIIHALSVVYEMLEVKRSQAEAMVRFFFETRQWKFGPGTPAKVQARRGYWMRRLARMK